MIRSQNATGSLAYKSFTVLVGILAGSDTEDRAVLTGLRNFVRDMGGATGTTGMYQLLCPDIF